MTRKIHSIKKSTPKLNRRKFVSPGHITAVIKKTHSSSKFQKLGLHQTYIQYKNDDDPFFQKLVVLLPMILILYKQKRAEHKLIAFI